jgi:GNAT superfamily N-acetyltransferase
MSFATWHEEPIRKHHHVEAFDCGEPALNEFLRRHARKSHDLGGSKTFLAIDDSDGKTILGFYSLSPATVFYSGTSENLESGLAGREIPAFWLARRAVDRPVQGRGLAGQLLLAAGRRCVLASSEVGGEVLLIEATSERVAAWYASYGAMPLMDAPLKLVLPLKTLEAALRAAGAL